MKTPLYPLLLKSTLHVKVWGGRQLEGVLNKHLPSAEPYGESWELHDTSTVANGALAGQTLGALLADYGAELIGPDSDPAEGLPLLVKLIDATDWLSVQVHPDDEQAREYEGDPRGKSEAWYILAARPESKLVIGVEPGVTREELAEAIRTNTLEALLVYAPVAPGDALFIPAGTVHAIGAGVLLYEIQQSSDVTYRLYDWGRMGLDGNPRPLHIEKGVAVSRLDTLPQVKHTHGDAAATVSVVSSPHFTTLLHQLDGEIDLMLTTNGRRFHALTCIEGEAVIYARETQTRFVMGQTALIPASLGAYTLTGAARILRSTQPE